MSMINMKVFALIAEALPRCNLMVSAGDLLIIDLNAEIIGEINFKAKCITVYREYTHAMKVVRRLRRASIPVELRELSEMEQITKILYDTPSRL